MKYIMLFFFSFIFTFVQNVSDNQKDNKLEVEDFFDFLNNGNEKNFYHPSSNEQKNLKSNKLNLKKCNHKNQINQKTIKVKTNMSQRMNEEKTKLKTFSKFRIHFDYTYTLAHERKILEDLIIPPIRSFLENTLKVERSPGKLRLPKESKCFDIEIPEYLTDEGVSSDLVILLSTRKGLNQFKNITKITVDNSSNIENSTNSTISSFLELNSLNAQINQYFHNIKNLDMDENFSFPVIDENKFKKIKKNKLKSRKINSFKLDTKKVNYKSLGFVNNFIETLRNIGDKLNKKDKTISNYFKKKNIDDKIEPLINEIIAKYSKSYYSSSKFENQENSESTSNNDVVGWAVHCFQDDFTLRPIGGLMHYELDFQLSSSSIEETIWTTLHEFTHVLGFDFSLINDFIDDNYNKKQLNTTISIKSKLLGLQELIDEIKVYKDEKKYDKKMIISNVLNQYDGFNNQLNLKINNKKIKLRREITNTTSSYIDEKNSSMELKKIDLIVSENYTEILFDNTFDIYVLYEIVNNLNPNIKILMKSSNVLAKSKEHFGCQNMEGLELEHFGGLGTAFSHWSKRYLNGDYMVGDTNGEYGVSKITLAFLEDSGWYKVNYENSEEISWGNNKGCSFLTESCINGSIENTHSSKRKTKSNLRVSKSQYRNHEKILVNSNFDEFCEFKSDYKCSSSKKFRGACALSVHDNIPDQFQYFKSNKTIGGYSDLGDFCPYPIILINTNNMNLIGSCQTGGILNENSGESICEDCRCYESSLIDIKKVEEYIENYKIKEVEKSKIINDYMKQASFYDKAICYETRCWKKDDKTVLSLIIGDTEVNCPENGGLTTVSGYLGYVNCPIAEQFCENFKHDYNRWNSAYLTKNLSNKINLILEDFMQYLSLENYDYLKEVGNVNK